VTNTGCTVFTGIQSQAKFNSKYGPEKDYNGFSAGIGGIDGAKIKPLLDNDDPPAIRLTISSQSGGY
jgi:hypothetical protein